MWGINKLFFLLRRYFSLKRMYCLWWAGINRRLHNLIRFHIFHVFLSFYYHPYSLYTSGISHKSFSLRINKFIILFLFSIILSFDPISILPCNVFSFKRNGSVVYGLGFLGPQGSWVLVFRYVMIKIILIK